MSTETIAALQAGAAVQITGAMASLHGKDYFLARELTAGGHMVTIRSEHGFLVHEHSPRMARSKSEGKSRGSAQKGSEL